MPLKRLSLSKFMFQRWQFIILRRNHQFFSLVNTHALNESFHPFINRHHNLIECKQATNTQGNPVKNNHNQPQKLNNLSIYLS